MRSPGIKNETRFPFLLDVLQRKISQTRFSKDGQVFKVSSAKDADSGIYVCSATNNPSITPIQLRVGKLIVRPGEYHFLLFSRCSCFRLFVG